MSETPQPGPWDRMIADRQAAIATLPGYAAYPANATTWQDYAERCFVDLLVYDDSWFDEPATGIRGYRPYVKGTDGWGGADRTREITELMAAMDVLWPMFRYLQLHPDAQRQAQVDAFIAELPKYYDASVGQSTNRPGETRHDSWYFMENSVLKYGHLFMISAADGLQTPYFGSLGSAIEMAHNFDYLFPQFVGLDRQPAPGYNTQNYSTAGLLAYALVDGYQLTGDAAYLQEAERALLAMRDANPFLLLYEPQELAAAAAAAARLASHADQIDTATDFTQLAQDFFYAQTQMLYYDEGQTGLIGFERQRSEWLPAGWRDGMFSPYYNPVEAGGINAPAFKENFEALLFWADYLRHMADQPGFDRSEPLKILNLNRIKGFYFFSPNIPDAWERDYGPTSLQYIPYEDIDYYAVREYEDRSVRLKAGYNGKEIYGAGETLWAYLLFEALGQAADRNALLVNLNVLDQEYPPRPVARAYLAFNPYGEERTLAFTLKHLAEPYTLYADGIKLGDYRPGDAFSITLPALGSALITVAS